jgi:hypothetical protein
MTTNVASKWRYSGDGNLEYGGSFIDLSDWKWGYCNAVRVTDIDSGCGFRGAAMIEHVVICGVDDAKRIRKAWQSCGYDFNFSYLRRQFSAAEVKVMLRHAIAEALLSYGYFDEDEQAREVVQMEQNGPMKFDGWKADKRLHNTTLEAYVQSQHLKD